MIDQTFIDSVFNKIEKYFFLKKIIDVITVLDEEDIIINNVVYFKMDDGPVGIFINGTNPFFTQSFIEDVDTFNLYENYQYLRIIVKSLNDFYIDSIKIVFNADYNEILGLYLEDTFNNNSLSVLFTYDELYTLEDLKFDEYLEKVNQTLQHVDNKIVFSIEKDKKWRTFP